jgi:methylase of polypeptide subunit release factors
LTAAAAPLWLLVGGRAIGTAIAERGLGPAWSALRELGVLEVEGDEVTAVVTLLPIGEALIVRLPRTPGEAGAPDDSSAHLASVLGRRRSARWLDVGTGNGYVPLARLGRAGEVLATDVDATALACARAGIILSGATALTVRAADLLDGSGGDWDLITFNAPIPGDDDPGASLLARFWEQAAPAIAGDGEVVVHSVLGHAPRLPGRTVVARYTPPGLEPAFGLTRWQPGAPKERIERAVELTPAHPHVRAEHLA